MTTETPEQMRERFRKRAKAMDILVMGFRDAHKAAEPELTKVAGADAETERWRSGIGAHLWCAALLAGEFPAVDEAAFLEMARMWWRLSKQGEGTEGRAP